MFNNKQKEREKLENKKKMYEEMGVLFGHKQKEEIDSEFKSLVEEFRSCDDMVRKQMIINRLREVRPDLNLDIDSLEKGITR